jgi:coenzyme F420-dependent glucose-6-phosphate dehydrogenase
MVDQWGYALSSEEHPPGELVANAPAAEAAGFDFLSISDHFHPWTEAQGHSPFVWAVLGGIAATTERVEVGTGVTCPILRIHPVVVAHAVATTARLFDGRFFCGVGTGEALNEHVLGQRWPRPETRREMLEEAIEIMRDLFTGETVDRQGRYYEVENARLFDPPSGRVPIIVSGFGPNAAKLAARIGDGYWGHGDTEPLQAYAEAGGQGPHYAQLNCCWAQREDAARDVVARVWPNAAVPGQLSQDLPTWTHFQQAASLVSADMLAESIPCGPDIAGPLVEKAGEYARAGYDRLYFHQIGSDQAGFLRYWESDLRPALREAGIG